MSGYSADLICGEASTTRANELLEQIKFIPELMKQLQEQPGEAIAKFEEIRRHSTFVTIFIHDLALTLRSDRSFGHEVLRDGQCT